MGRVVHWADRVASLLSAAAALVAMAMAVFVVLASTMRYLVGAPFAFTEEIVGLLFITMIFVGFPACTLREKHIRVTILPDLLPPPLRSLMDRVANGLLVVFCVWFGYLTLDYMNTAIALETRSAGSRLLLWPWTAVLPISCALAGLAGLIRMIVPSPLSASPDGVDHPGAD
ncbi:TRAP transporter small permease [Rhodoligotrophos defluvii]|uniref:TRAP transporter small permease n=1 Tax=Rhodoligotrophos defluvii TaxID=2561934 RepID=UPI001960F85B|nr:TRAP transporter small permease [Rhodoligotrophos defluvii]